MNEIILDFSRYYNSGTMHQQCKYGLALSGKGSLSIKLDSVDALYIDSDVVDALYIIESCGNGNRHTLEMEEMIYCNNCANLLILFLV